MKRAVVLDLATAAFAYTDRNQSLESACHAFDLPLEERPGVHSGAITRENVAGCLQDVAKTSELLWAIDAEHRRHPTELHLSRAQSGASIAKAYLDAVGVRPRLEIQPEFPKELLGYSAQAYYGGRVEARIVKTPLPCAYLDFLSMYPTVFALLGLWFKHVTPATLEVEEIPPAEIAELLGRLRANPDSLFDPAAWSVLDFFALVEPNGANLPARAVIPRLGLSRRERVASEAAYRYEETFAAQAPFWSALDECGGKIVPDMLFNARRKRWKAAGEFDDIPRGLLRRNSRRPAQGQAFGNIDEITQSIRDAMDAPDLTTSDVLEFFATHRRPTIADARRDVRDEMLPDDEQRAANAVVTIGPVESQRPLWYAGPDLAAAAISGGEPRIVRAWRLRPHGTQETLQRLALRSADAFDPEREDLFARFVELRRRKSSDAFDDERRSTGYKVIANSGAYGVFAETNPIDVDTGETGRKARRVTVYAETTFESEVDRPERPGRFSFFPTASVVTAGARLMLALAQHYVEQAGGEVIYCDTDGAAAVATKDGGFVPCEGGPYRLANGTRAIRALSWAQVDAIRERFAALNPYDREAVHGTILKLEDENFTDERREERCELYCYAVSEKLYALFTLDERGEPVIRKYSSHVLGQYRSPMQGDRHGWIIDAWKREIRASLGRPAEPFAWEQYPAVSQLTLTTWNVFEPYRENNRLRPFDFLAVGVVNRSAVDLAIEEVEGLERCCEEPRPACALFSDLARWREQDWRCLRCGAPWNFELRPRLKTYARLIRSTLQGAERKRLAADGTVPTRQTRGLLIPRPVRVEHVTPIGKEVIVDPTDTDEGLTAEMLGVTEVLEYQDQRKRLDSLRVKITEAGESLTAVAREAKIDRRTLQRFVNRGVTLHESTIDKLQSVFEES